jgi:hypothetical protein
MPYSASAWHPVQTVAFHGTLVWQNGQVDDSLLIIILPKKSFCEDITARLVEFLQIKVAQKKQQFGNFYSLMQPASVVAK